MRPVTTHTTTTTNTPAAFTIAPAQGAFFRIRAETGEDPDAGTDARVYVDLVGSRGVLKDLYLRDQGDAFYP